MPRSLHALCRVLRPMTVLVCLLSPVGANQLHGDEWTRFRGPNGSGIGRDIRLPVSWAEDEVEWRVKLPGSGHASPVGWGNRLFLTAAPEDSGERTVLCLDPTDGRTVWMRQFEAATHSKHALNSFASSTPAVDSERIYLSWGTPEEYIVQVLDHDGNPLWRRDLGPFRAGHGFGSSPILFDGKVILANDQGGDSSLVALNVGNGEVVWQVPRETDVAYSTPCLYQPPGRPAELIFTTWKRGITAVDARTGRTNWEIQVFDQEHSETAISSPIVSGKLVFGTCGYLGYNTHTVAVEPVGVTEAREVFRVDKAAPLTTTPLVVGGLMFLWADNGIVTCTDARDGTRHWRKRVGGTYYGSPVAVGDAVYCQSAQGEVIVIAASSRYTLLARNPLGEGSHSTPAVIGGRMLLRTFTHLISISGERTGGP